MDEVDRPERSGEPDDLWPEALWSVGLIGSALLLVFLVSLLGRL